MRVQSIVITMKGKNESEGDASLTYENERWTMTGAVYPRYILLMSNLNELLLRERGKENEEKG